MSKQAGMGCAGFSLLIAGWAPRYRLQTNDEWVPARH